MRCSNNCAARLKPIPLLLAAALLLTACAGSRVSVSPEPADFRPLPPEFRRACAGPVALPDAALSQAGVEAYWLKDRAALKACGGRHVATVKYWDAVSGERIK